MHGKQTTTADAFKVFLYLLKKKIVADPTIEIKKSIIFFDNARVHTADIVQEISKELGLYCLYNAPYCPHLNMAEQYILAHKQKIRKELSLLK